MTHSRGARLGRPGEFIKFAKAYGLVALVLSVFCLVVFEWWIG